ncbi:Uncharacterised protein at_DN1048 [Pycnogonum litorale]
MDFHYSKVQKKIQFWPILDRIVELKKSAPFIIGMFFGEQKPKCIDEYLQDFVNEMKGIEWNSLQLKFSEKDEFIRMLQIECFICDAPARAFVKQVKGHNAYHGCEKCSQHGVWKDKVVFPQTNFWDLAQIWSTFDLDLVGSSPDLILIWLGLAQMGLVIAFKSI